MPVTIPDDVLAETGLTERELLIEVACRLFAARKLEKFPAMRLCGLTRVQFDDELYARELPVHFYTEEMLEQDLRAMAELNERGQREAHRAGRQ